jgi:hypothetical protein
LIAPRRTFGLERSLRAPRLTSGLEIIFPATIIFLLALPHVWCTTFRNRGYPLPTPPNLPGFIGATPVPPTIHSAGSVLLLTHSAISLLVATQTNDARTFESSKSMGKARAKEAGCLYSRAAQKWPSRRPICRIADKLAPWGFKSSVTLSPSSSLATMRSHNTWQQRTNNQ